MAPNFYLLLREDKPWERRSICRLGRARWAARKQRVGSRANPMGLHPSCWCNEPYLGALFRTVFGSLRLVLGSVARERAISGREGDARRARIA